jgi:hypothetical protein
MHFEILTEDGVEITKRNFYYLLSDDKLHLSHFIVVSHSCRPSAARLPVIRDRP